MPPLGDAAALWLWLQDAGIHSMGPAGPVCLSWPDLAAWSEGSGIRPQPWQASAMRAASAAWALAYAHGADADAPAPWITGQRSASQRRSVDGRLRGIFSSLSARAPAGGNPPPGPP